MTNITISKNKDIYIVAFDILIISCLLCLKEVNLEIILKWRTGLFDGYNCTMNQSFLMRILYIATGANLKWNVHIHKK